MDCYIPFSVFEYVFLSSQWHSQFSSDNLRVLYDYLADMDMISMDPGAISMQYEELKLKDISTDVDHTDYVELDIDYPDSLEWLYDKITDGGFWNEFTEWKTKNKTAINRALKSYNEERYSQKEYYDTVNDFEDHELALLVRYRTDRAEDLYKFVSIDQFIDNDSFDTISYFNAVMDAVDIIGNRLEYFDPDTIVLITKK